MKLHKSMRQWPGQRWLLLACVCVVMFAISNAAAQQNTISWHAKGWKYRVIVLVPETDVESAGMDVAQVRLDHAGAMLANADDVRIFDLAGNALPYEVTYQDPARYALISFQCPPQQSYRVIYFGNNAAVIDPMRTIVDTASAVSMPVPGPAAQGWQPRAGMVLSTYARPLDASSPQTPQEMEALLAKAIPKPHGAGYRSTISDGVNPFGASYNYVSIYRGWIKLPESGAWRFCTASSNASFSFMNGQKLVHWPGDHHSGHGQRGEFNTTVSLKKGLHYVAYFHERHQHRPLAFLGISRPDQKQFEALSAVTVPQPRQATIRAYETQDRRTQAVPRIEIQDAVLFRHPTLMSLTRVRFRASVPADQEGEWQVTWDTGDGQSVSGISAEHVYLEPGVYKVTMRATGSQGQRIEMDWPLDVYPDMNQPDDVQTVRATAYGALLDAAKPDQYIGHRAVMLALVLNEIDHRDQAKTAARTALFMQDLLPVHLPKMLAMAYEDAPASASQTRKLVNHMKHQLEQLQHANVDTERVQWLASLIQITGTWQRDVSTAAKMNASIETLRQNRNPSRELKEALQQCALAMGDGYLFAGRVIEAKTQYQLASSLATRNLSEAQLRTRSGMFPQQVNDQLDAGKPELALVVVEQWKNEIPTDRLSGLPWFHEGKSYLLKQNPQAALHRLVPAIKLLRGAADEAQAYWLTAEAYRQAGQQEQAVSIMRELTASGLTGQWVDRAQKSLEKQAMIDYTLRPMQSFRLSRILLSLLTILFSLTFALPMQAADKTAPQPVVADVTRGKPPVDAVNLLPTGDFEVADETGNSPKGWQSVDGLVWQWISDTDSPEHGKILRVNTDVKQSQAYQWWARHYVHHVPLAEAPAPEPTRPPRYDTIGGLDGGFYWSAFFPIEKGKAYKVYIDAKGPQSQVFLRGYVKELPVSFADESPAVQAVMRKARNVPEIDAKGRPVRYRLRYKYTTWFAVGGSDEWETYTHIKPRHPTSREITEDVRFLRVMIYPFWPAGVYDYDNVRVVEVEPDVTQARPDVPEVDREEGNVIR